MESHSKFTFHEGKMPAGYRLGFTPYLFNTPEHLRLQSKKEQVSYYMLRADKKQVLAAVHFFLIDNQAVSPCRAPFGSFQFATGLDARDLFDFIQWVENQLRLKRVQSIRIKSAPDSYNTTHTSLLHVLLLNQNYRIQQAEVGACLSLDAGKFSELIHTWEKRKLNQAKKSGLTFRKLALKSLPEIYQFIALCRREREFDLSMSLEDLNGTAQAFKNQFLLFATFNETELTAAAVVVEVASDILYTFYYAHAQAYDSLSPVVFLINGIYEWAAQNNYRLIDLGTSALESGPNFPLLHFKLNLGAKPTSKFTFEKDLR